MSVLMIIMQVEEKRNKIAGTFQYGSNGEVLSCGRSESCRVSGIVCGLERRYHGKSKSDL